MGSAVEDCCYTAGMKIATAVLLAVSTFAFGQDVPRTMTMLTVKLESPDIPKESFAAQPKRIYRAGTRYCRTEENPDIQNGIHGLMIINEPDVWMVNRLDKSARHIIDTGPTYNCRMPMFINVAEDMKKTLAELEFGRELDFFRPKSPTPNPGPVLLGKATMVHSATIGDSQLFLFTATESGVPVSVVRKTEKTREIFWYGEYRELPFDGKLFAKPDGVKIEESKP